MRKNLLAQNVAILEEFATRIAGFTFRFRKRNTKKQKGKKKNLGTVFCAKIVNQGG